MRKPSFQYFQNHTCKEAEGVETVCCSPIYRLEGVQALVPNTHILLEMRAFNL